MPTVIIRTPGGKTAFASGPKVTLTAENSGYATAYQWTKNGAPIAGATSSQYAFEMTADAEGLYVVIASINGAEVSSPAVRITLPLDKGAAGDAPEPVTTGEPAPTFHPVFAAFVGLVGLALAVGLALMAGLPDTHAGLSNAEWRSLDGRLKVGVVMALPIMLLGGLAVLVGLWMAVVEWRGRLAEMPKMERPKPDGEVQSEGVSVEPDKIIAAVGKLRGAALAMAVGTILLVASAWVAQSAAGTTPAATSSPSSGAASPAP
jgi:hypothetical protein